MYITTGIYPPMQMDDCTDEVLVMKEMLTEYREQNRILREQLVLQQAEAQKEAAEPKARIITPEFDDLGNIIRIEVLN